MTDTARFDSPNDASAVMPPGSRATRLNVEQFAQLVAAGHFDRRVGRTELINGRIVHMNPQGPQYADPIDLLEEWSHRVAGTHYRIRTEKPILIPQIDSLPEPDLAWVRRQSYARRHPLPEEVFLLVEVSVTSMALDRGERMEAYAKACIREYWQLDVMNRQLRIHLDPSSGVYRSITTFHQTQSVSPGCLPAALLMIADLFE